MREAVIVDSVRTALAKSHRGSFNRTHPADLAAHCISEVMKRAPQVDPAEDEDVILGCRPPHGPQGMNVARVAAVLAGLPVSVAATTVNRFCSSGLQATAMAAHQIINEGADAVHQGVCTPEAADLAMKLGVSYPAGPFEFLARWDATAVAALLDHLDAHYRGERYRVSPGLRDRACLALLVAPAPG